MTALARGLPVEAAPRFRGVSFVPVPGPLTRAPPAAAGRVLYTRRSSNGGIPTSFDSERCKRRNEVERAINRHITEPTPADTPQRAYIFQGTPQPEGRPGW
ncbi:hypothetical protein ACFCYH_35175 [Streptomyces sp. NPDC056400]|uniref:hypothetical protein n=1 Tax=Streptomyces sp. NPDC056400 TaxID=3345808 RepID=UPI0035DA1B84